MSEKDKKKNEEVKQTDKEAPKVGDTNFFLNPMGHVRDRIVINPREDIPSEGVFISLNGYGFLAKPGEEVDIPRPVRLMLDTRIVTETKQDESGKEYKRDLRRMTYTLIAENVNQGGKVEKPPAKETVS